VAVSHRGRAAAASNSKKQEKPMGIDMYAFTTAPKPASPVDFDIDVGTEFYYWRKHPNLHGWMEALYRQKGGSKPSFNCVPVVLEADDLDRLEANVKAGQLPETEGFFFGASDGTEREGDLAFIAKARRHLADGLTVYYTSWW
jgi:hypothetical protein